MAQTSVGFNGSISAVQWAQNAPLLMGSGYVKGSPTDCRLGTVAGQRQVTVSTGKMAGDGVVTSLDALETITVPAPTNGQWFLLVLTRNWGSASTAFNLRNGPTTAAAFGFLPPSTYPASTLSNPGVTSDLPVAWLWANSSSTDVYYFPLLAPSAAAYPRSGSTAQRGTVLQGLTSNAPTPYRWQWFASISPWWNNSDTGQREFYVSGMDWVQPFYDTGWQALPTPSPGYSGQSGQDVGVRLKSGIVMTRGQFNRTGTNTVATGDRLATFPAGMRPGQTMLLPARAESGVDMLLRLTTDGNLVVFRTSSTTGKYVILDNLEWFADQ